MSAFDRTRLLWIAALGIASLTSASSSALAGGAGDNFDRPDSTNLGPDWFEDQGNTVIKNNMGKGASGAFNKGWMHHTSFTAAYADSVQVIDFQATASSESVVLMAGLDPNTWGCVSVKIQDNNGDGLFDRVFFEQAFNAGSWGSGNPVIYDLVTPTASGSLLVRFTNGGDVVVCEITNNASAQVETCSAAGILSFAFPITGTCFGIGHSGAPSFDNWSVDAYDPTYGNGCAGSGGFVPALNSTIIPSSGGPLDVSITNGLGGAPCFFFFGFAQTQVPMGLTGCDLLITPILPPSFALTLPGSGPGNGALTLNGTMPAVPSGFMFTMQAFIADPGDPDGFSATNGLMIVIP